MNNISTIGNVKFIDYSNKDEKYSDGKAEDELLTIFKSRDSSVLVKNILDNEPSWPMRYHLSPIRENLLSWYDFDKDKNILEVGAGCGALTGLFADKTKEVVAIELSRKRAQIIANRFKDRHNLEVVAGNIKNVGPNRKFDYVTSIGVLEYSGMFFDVEKPYEEYLSVLKSFMGSNGKLILAIENKFGLKYWSGLKEDHTGNLFDSLEDYPNTSKIKTFSKKELSELLKKIGFKKIEFYYPMPDYKLPIEIFSDKYLPTMKHNIQGSMFPFKDYNHKRKTLFDEKLAMDNIIRNEMFDFFANSFLVFAK